jgi:hypothetical protein
LQPGGHRFDPGQLHQICLGGGMKRRDGELRWHGLRISNMPVGIAAGLVFVMGVVVLGSFGFPAGWFAASVVILGIGIVGILGLVRKVKS